MGEQRAGPPGSLRAAGAAKVTEVDWIASPGTNNGGRGRKAACFAIFKVAWAANSINQESV